LRFFGGLHNNEISAILGLDERTVAAHLCRGVQDLQRRYTAERHAEAVMEAKV
jgi:DNA-directed RNA polymerase specialized sigma24 family protein